MYGKRLAKRKNIANKIEENDLAELKVLPYTQGARTNCLFAH